MYLEHFGLTSEPFGLTPDTSCFVATPTHQEALNVVLLGLRLGAGFIKVSGEIGLGKTLLCRRLLNLLGRDYVTAFLPHPEITPAELRRSLARELGAPPRLWRLDTAALQSILLTYARAGRSAVLFIDEAQRTPRETFEYVRLLTNLETEKHKLLQVVLFGQPELDRRLARRDHRQLAQRIVYSYRLKPLDPKSTEAYLGHRLALAGADPERLFSRSALRTIVDVSRGVPRLINVCAQKALLAAYGEGAKRIRRRHVQAAVRDTESLHQPGWGWQIRRIWS